MRKNGQYALPAFIPLETGRPSRPSGVFDALSLTGFTLVEVIIVLMVIGIIAAVAVPLYTSAASIQLKTAADMIACDLEYAKSMAMSTGKKYSVVFDTSASVEGYRINDVNGQVISHPVHIGVNYIVSFAGDSRLSKVDIVSTTFGSNTVKFDYLGSPDNGGSVQLRAGGNILTVKVEPVTGYVSIE